HSKGPAIIQNCRRRPSQSRLRAADDARQQLTLSPPMAFISTTADMTMTGAMEHRKRRGQRLVLATIEDVRAAVSEITSLADRTLAILTHDLEPDIYDHDDFLEPLK